MGTKESRFGGTCMMKKKRDLMRYHAYLSLNYSRRRAAIVAESHIVTMF